MSFRIRLTLFFLLIVVLPMVAVAALVTGVASDSATGKTDAALGEDLEVATGLYAQSLADAGRVGERIIGDPRVRAALIRADDAALERALREVASERDLAALIYRDLESGETFRVRSSDFGRGAVALEDRDTGERTGQLIVSTTTAERFAREVSAATAENVAVIGPDGSNVGTLDVDAEDVPPGSQSGELPGEDDVRIAAAELPGAAGYRVAVAAPAESGGFLASRPGVAFAILAFIALALLASGLITRTLQGQIGSMLVAARRIGQGDFTGQVPVVGNDEMADLAREFNEMRDRLSAQMDQLRRQQLELEGSVTRIGEAFASGLDRQALLEILIETAVGACDADYGLIALSGRVGAEAEVGEADDRLAEVALATERQALSAKGAIQGDRDGAFALSSSLGNVAITEEALGAMTVARAGRAFTTQERDVFLYLVGQAAASVENVALHELVSEQAVTDELTGLANNRAFRETLDKEAARAARFRHDLSLLILDIDDFKKVNDKYGHMQGDAVLRAIGEILDAESRAIDEPARYGGEEFVVALPETDPEGALEVAERIRARIEHEPVPRVEGRGKIKVTASLGVATMPAVGVEVPDLFAAADGALYEAKRTGKNRVRVAQGNGSGWRTDAQ
ncbi:MAG TPA: diguanylate cyclase [Solirubrobacterales bacterium]|nr:diguanylate cyclase [Solirubrobacterales bacterium]